MSSDIVPCEMCGAFVEFDEYITHLENCYIVTRTRNMMNNTNQHTASTLPTSDLEEAIQHNMTNFMHTAFENNDLDFNRIVSLLPTFFNTSNNFNFNLELHRIDLLVTNLDMDVSSIYTPLTNEEITSIQDPQNCSVCYESKRSLVKTTCNHIYCKECIDAWLVKKKTCPICLKDFSIKKIDLPI